MTRKQDIAMEAASSRSRCAPTESLFFSRGGCRRGRRAGELWGLTFVRLTVLCWERDAGRGGSSGNKSYENNSLRDRIGISGVTSWCPVDIFPFFLFFFLLSFSLSFFIYLLIILYFYIFYIFTPLTFFYIPYILLCFLVFFYDFYIFFGLDQSRVLSSS